MRGQGYTTLKGRQVQISLYLPPQQYWSLRAATRKTGLSIQVLLRRALERVVREARLASFAEGDHTDPAKDPSQQANARPGKRSPTRKRD